MIPLLPFEPDKGPYAAGSIDYVMNALPVANGWGPMPSLSAVSDSLGAQCRGAVWYRNTAGTYGFIAATAKQLYRLGSDGSWSDISRNQVTNGTFDSDTGWTKDANVTISGGVASLATAGVVTALSQSQTFTAGATYRITFTISGYSAGGIRPRLTGGTSVSGTTRTANGTYTEVLTAVSGNNTFGIGTNGATTLNVDNVIIQKVDAYALADGHLWQFEMFGSKLYATNLNDPLQVLDVDTGTHFVSASGSPPQAKFIRTIGDFLFLAHLKSGATTYPQRWQHSKINDPTSWTVDGSVGGSDQQDIPDGGEITGILPLSGGARIIQRNAKRLLTFTPGSAFSFSSSDIDTAQGAAAPYATVSIGNGAYFYVNETGFYMNDAHTPIGAERVDDFFFASLDTAKLAEVQAIADPYQKMVWVAYLDQSGTRRMIGYHWQLDRWTQADAQPELLVTAVTAGSVLDDLDDLGELDDILVPLESSSFQGSYPSFGAFTSSDILSMFGGSGAAAVIETTTTELTPESGSFVTGAKVKGKLTNYSMQVGKATLPDEPLTWSASTVRSQRTGMVPFRSDGKYHRFRVNIDAGSDWTHIHGVTPFFIPSGFA